jgi:hypothetical protein
LNLEKNTVYKVSDPTEKDFLEAKLRINDFVGIIID